MHAGFGGELILQIQIKISAESRAAYNKSIAASGAGRWQLRQLFALVLQLRLEVSNLAFCFYLQFLNQTRQQLPESGFSNAPPAAIPVRWWQ